MCTPTQLDHDLFRILLCRRNGKELLLEHHDQGFALPTVLIPRFTRVAQQITAAIRKDWNIQTACLFPIGDRNSSAYAVELWGETPAQSANRTWLPAHSLAEKDFRDGRDFQILETASTIFDRQPEGKTAGPFGKLGWLRDVTGWVEAKASTIGLCLTGEFEQLNASPTFSLIRFETDGPALWFKAIGEPNLHEYPITIEIVSAFPAFVPRMIATRQDWNAWLTVEAAGTHLDENSDTEAWTRVAATLAELQIASFGQTQHLLKAGCRDVRACTLVERVEPFLEMMTDLMERQTKQSPPPLSRSELVALQTQLAEALSQATESEVPNVLGHLDFNPGNIVVNSNGCAFLDWAEACAGTPFITFQYLLEHLRRRGQQSCESAIASAYLNAWRRFFSLEKIAAALRVSALLAVFAYAVCGNTWRDPAERNRPETAGYFRSLTRRMKREADGLHISGRRRLQFLKVRG